MALVSTLSSISRAATGKEVVEGGVAHSGRSLLGLVLQQAPNRSLTAVTSWGLWYKKEDGPRDYAHVLVQSCKYPRTPYFLLQALEEPRYGDTDCCSASHSNADSEPRCQIVRSNPIKTNEAYNQPLCEPLCKVGLAKM